MNDWKSQSMNSVGFPGERIAWNARYRGGWHVDQSQVKMIPVSINISVEQKQLTIICTPINMDHPHKKLGELTTFYT